MEGQSARAVLLGLAVTSAVFISLDTLILTLRVVSRCFVKKVAFGWDDVLLYSGYIVNVGLCVMGFVISNYMGAGNPPADDQFYDPIGFHTHLEPTLKSLYALGPLFAFGYSLPKISLLLFYLRIFVQKKVRLAIWIMMSIVVAEMLAFLIAACLYCIPVAYYWTRQGDGQCFDADVFYRVTAVIKLVIDLSMVALPLRPLWQLQVPKLKKIGLCCVFLTSVIGVIGGIIRFVFLLIYSIHDITPTTVSRTVAVIIVEPNLFFIAACLPACSSLFTEIFRRPAVRKLFSMKSTQAREHGLYSGLSERRTVKKTPRASDDFERLVRDSDASDGKWQSRSARRYDEEREIGIAMHDFAAQEKPST